MKHNITVDYKAMAQGLYEMFTEEEVAALKFGLLPAVKMAVLRHYLEQKAKALIPDPEALFDKATLDEMECIGLAEEGRRLAKAERKEWVRDTERKICLELYAVAPMLV